MCRCICKPLAVESHPSAKVAHLICVRCAPSPPARGHQSIDLAADIDRTFQVSSQQNSNVSRFSLYSAVFFALPRDPQTTVGQLN